MQTANNDDESFESYQYSKEETIFKSNDKKATPSHKSNIADASLSPTKFNNEQTDAHIKKL